MASPLASGEAPGVPLRGELRYGLELARLLADRDFHRPSRRPSDSAMLLVPGFMAGDQSLSVLAGWLRRRGSWEACLDPSAEHVEVESSHVGMSVNPRVYRVLARILDQEGDRWTG
jgi:hypothetical protein